jgi:hypothetical protein
LHDVARIVDDFEPPFMRAVLDRLFLSAGIGKDQVVVSPIVWEALDPFRALLGPVRQDGNLQTVRRVGHLAALLAGYENGEASDHDENDCGNPWPPEPTILGAHSVYLRLANNR